MKKLLLLFLILPCISFAQSPVKIIKYKLIQDEIGDPVIVITYKNESNKSIDALTFSVDCYDNFNEPVNKISGGNTYTGIAQETLKPGKKTVDSWTMYLFDNTTKVSTPEITKVHFTDGSTWKFNSSEKD